MCPGDPSAGVVFLNISAGDGCRSYFMGGGCIVRGQTKLVLQLQIYFVFIKKKRDCLFGGKQQPMHQNQLEEENAFF